MSKTLLIIGAGAAGCFAAIHAKATNPDATVIVLEATARPLAKVRISGGGRCNVTHTPAIDRTALIAAYPRGGKALHSLFARFSPQDTVDWFAAHGVPLKTEADGRMFPTTDDSATVVNALLTAMAEAGVTLRTQSRVTAIHPQPTGGFQVIVNDSCMQADAVLVATGSNPQAASWMEALGQPWINPVPSLFTFCVSHPVIEELAGVSVPNVVARLQIPGQKKPMEQAGPLLITHWGLSGPAILKLSAFGARALHQANYQLPLTLDLCPALTHEQLTQQFIYRKTETPRQLLGTLSAVPNLPKRLWGRFLDFTDIPPDTLWTDCSNKALTRLAETIKRLPLVITGKGVFKEEFVTAGGVDLKGINMQTLESRLVPALYFAGEVLDIDGITGGFNFQAAWATGYLAGQHLATVAR